MEYSGWVKSQLASIEDSLAEVIDTPRSRLVHGVYPNSRTVNLDFVGIHSGIRDKNLCVLHHLRLPHPDLLVQYKTDKKWPEKKPRVRRKRVMHTRRSIAIFNIKRMKFTAHPIESPTQYINQYIYIYIYITLLRGRTPSGTLRVS